MSETPAVDPIADYPAFIVRDCGNVATRSSWREIIELAPLISARAVYHAREFVRAGSFCRRALFVTARAFRTIALFGCL